MIHPSPLRSGDRVAVVATSGPAQAERVARGVEVLRSWGLEVDELDSVRASEGYLAGPDSLRRDDLQKALTDDTYAAVFAARGGFGSQRIIDDIDWEAVGSAAPRHVVGFSDITALHQALRLHVGWASIHGPVVTSLGEAPESVQGRLRDLLFTPETVDVLCEGEVMVPGAAVGPLVGGNLAMLATSIGTPIQGSADGGVVVLEDVFETPYKLDRLVTQLERSGWLDGAHAVVCGHFTDCGPPDEVRAMFQQRLGALGVPVVWGAEFGHIPDNLALPLGAEVTLTDGVLRRADPTID